MRKFHGLLSGAALLGASAILCAQPVLAGPKAGKEARKEERKEAKEARKEFKKERKEFRKADTPSERREAKEDMRTAKRDLKSERRDVRQGRKGNAYNSNRRYDNNRRSDYLTLDGTVTKDLRGNAFMLRADSGQVMRVQVQGNEPRRIDRGDRVRVSGFSHNNVFQAQSLTILQNR